MDIDTKILNKIKEQIANLEIVLMKMADVYPDPENPKDHSAEQIDLLCKSMSTVWTNPLILDENNMIIAGHGRYMAARQ